MGIVASSNVKEKDLIEYCLSLYHSGYNYTFILAFHSLINSWHIDKLNYYVKLAEGSPKFALPKEKKKWKDKD